MITASPGITDWLDQTRRVERLWSAVIAVVAAAGGTAVFLLTAIILYSILSVACGAFLNPGPSLMLAVTALVIAVGLFVRSSHPDREDRQRGLDSMGLWIIEDILAIGPGLIAEALRQVRRCGDLNELNVTACARALIYLATHHKAVPFEELARQCPQLSGSRLKQQLSLLHGVLFVGEDAERVTLMDPFRLRLRWILEREQTTVPGERPAASAPQPVPQPMQFAAPETLSPHELLGVPPAASLAQIKKAYRRRVKECHPDLFASMDERSKALAERWTRALNAAYADLKSRPRPHFD